jgi:hypothetical protein
METERIALSQRERDRLRVLHQKRRSGSRRATLIVSYRFLSFLIVSYRFLSFLIVSSRLSYIAMGSAVYKTHTHGAGESWRVNSKAGPSRRN